MTLTIAVDDELVSAYEREDAVNHDTLARDLEDAIRRHLQGVKQKHLALDAQWALQTFAQLPDTTKTQIMSTLSQVALPPSQSTGI